LNGGYRKVRKFNVGSAQLTIIRLLRNMEPTKKTKDLETFLEDGFGRNTAIENNNCVFCKTPVTDFRDEISIRE